VVPFLNRSSADEGKNVRANCVVAKSCIANRW
jgi:hypothetical protein